MPRKMQLDTEYTEVSTERTEVCLKKSPKGTSTQQVIINSGITTPDVFLPGTYKRSQALHFTISCCNSVDGGCARRAAETRRLT